MWDSLNTVGVLGGFIMMGLGVFITMIPFTKMKFQKERAVPIQHIPTGQYEPEGAHRTYDSRRLYSRTPSMESVQKRIDQMKAEEKRIPRPKKEFAGETLAGGTDKKLLPKYGSGSPTPKPARGSADEEAGAPAWEKTDGPHYEKEEDKKVLVTDKLEIIEDDKGPEAEGEFESIKVE